MTRKPALALLLCALLAGPAAHAVGDIGTLRVALHADIASINPGVNRDANADMVLAHVVEGLVALSLIHI